MNVDLSFRSSERLMYQWMEQLSKNKKAVETIINYMAIIS